MLSFLYFYFDQSLVHQSGINKAPSATSLEVNFLHLPIIVLIVPAVNEVAISMTRDSQLLKITLRCRGKCHMASGRRIDAVLMLSAIQ